jgi:hypothetical protein
LSTLVAQPISLAASSRASPSKQQSTTGSRNFCGSRLISSSKIVCASSSVYLRKWARRRRRRNSPFPNPALASSSFAFQSEAIRDTIGCGDPDAGLVADFDALKGPHFDPTGIKPEKLSSRMMTSAFCKRARARYRRLFSPWLSCQPVSPTALVISR